MMVRTDTISPLSTDAIPERSWHERRAFAMRVAGLVGGFVSGQGSVFAVQTWLLAQGRLSTVAEYGSALAVVSLAQWTADWGGLILLARYVLQQETRRIWPAIWIRLGLSTLIAAVMLWIAITYFAQPFGRGIVLGGAFIAPIWSLNLSGFFDGHGRNAANGIIVGLPWLASAITTFVVLRMGLPNSLATGIWVGGSYCLGCAICVGLQHVIAAPMWRRNSGSVRGNWRHAREFLREGAVYCLGEFSNQFYGRALIGIVSLSLGTQVTGIYVYIRQLLIGFAQVITFVRRVELPKLASMLGGPINLLALCRSQATSLGLACIVFVATALIFIVRHDLPPRYSEIAFYALFFAAVLPVWALSASIGQILVLRSDVRHYSTIVLVTIFVSALSTYNFTAVLGLTFIAICEFTMYGLQTLAFLNRVKS